MWWKKPKTYQILLKNVMFFECGDYKKSEQYVNNNTFVYFDPPYRPISRLHLHLHLIQRRF